MTPSAFRPSGRGTVSHFLHFFKISTMEHRDRLILTASRL